jgi:hypothetical protein
MDLLKAKIFLDKVNREFARMSKDPENIARIDIDIMQSYLRDLYDAFLSVPPAAPPSILPKSDSRRNSPPPRQEQPPEPPAPSEPPAPAPRREEPVPPPKKEEPVVPVILEDRPAPAAPPVLEPSANDAGKKSSNANITPDVEALFEFKEARELSEKLSEQPITDLRRAISLNDRLLLSRELFGNDNQLFETAIQTLNNFASFEQAAAYLIDNFVVQFDWTVAQKSTAAKKFIKLVRRRYK